MKNHLFVPFNPTFHNISASPGGAVCHHFENQRYCGTGEDHPIHRLDLVDVNDEFRLSPAQEAHLSRVTQRFFERVTEKYIRGAMEHGGFVLHKPGIIEMLEDEIIDAWVFLQVAREQRDHPDLINPREPGD